MTYSITLIRRSVGFRAALLSGAFLIGLSVQPKEAQACDSDPMIGAICIFAFNYCPAGFTALNGGTVAANSSYYSDFKELIGYTFDPQNMAVVLPDLAARAPMARSSPTSQPSPPNSVVLGQQRGSSTTTIPPESIPAHTHTAVIDDTQKLNAVITVATILGNQDPTANGVISVFPSNAFAAPAAQEVFVNMQPGTIPTTMPAAGTMSMPVADPHALPVPVVPPSLGLTICIATSGIYPTNISQN
jgi:Microcystin-dependent protein